MVAPEQAKIDLISVGVTAVQSLATAASDFVVSLLSPSAALTSVGGMKPPT